MQQAFASVGANQWRKVAEVDGEDWLDPDEMRFWRAFVEASGSVMQQLDAALKADANMTIGDYEVLVRLSEAPNERMRMSDLSSNLLHSQSRVTQQVGRLVDRGLIDKVKCENDRRVTYAVLTDEGATRLRAAAVDHVEQVRRHLLDLVPAEERDQLVTTLGRVIAHHRRIRP